MKLLFLIANVSIVSALVVTPFQTGSSRTSSLVQVSAVAVTKEESVQKIGKKETSLPLSRKGEKVILSDVPQHLPWPEEDDSEMKRQKRMANAERALDVFVVGLSHHKAAVETREKLAIPEAEWEEAARDIVSSSDGAIDEAAVLSTCNRFELYFSAKDARAGLAAASKYLQERSKLPMSTLRESLFMLSSDHASHHALRVAAGLDSLVVGEGQILSQMKQCYYHATASGAGGKVTTRLLNAAVAAGKRARDETDIAKGAVSISSAAYELAEDRLKAQALNGLPLTLKDAKITIVGAGTMTRLLLTHMASHGVTKFTLINRSEPRAREMADEFAESHGCEIQVIATHGDNNVIREHTKDAHVVFTSTSSDSFVFAKEHLTDRTNPLMLVDISVPRNVDPACDELDSVVAYDVDSLKAVVDRNTAKRKREIVQAEILLEEEKRAFRGWLDSLSAVPAITKLQKKAEALRLAEMKRHNAKLQHLSPREIEAVERLSRGIVSKLLHGPMSALRDNKQRTDNKQGVATPLRLVKNMFNL
mmetsp:Transcript_1607/g.2453  ORF Transcript_1607/g.2453 Transcript_1607/m.2453 type:complete len:535 (-) Transcript_1607:227-1831(-)